MQEFTKPVGLDNKIAEAYRALENNKPVLFYGPAGTGKTIAAWEVGNQIASRLGNEVIYMQLYPEVTKNVIIGGETIKNGNIVTDTGPILKIGGHETENGAVFIIDECTHATEPALLGFNSLIEAPFQTVVGAKVHHLHPNTRFIFAGNPPNHEGNITLPQSFANRLYIVDFPVPPDEQLATIIKVVNKLADDYPLMPLIDYILDIASKVRSDNFSISPRNLLNCAALLDKATSSGDPANEKLKHMSKRVAKVLKDNKMRDDVVRNIILATMLGNVVTSNQGPDKVKAMLWEE
jgi:MoxR-like ATPase